MATDGRSPTSLNPLPKSGRRLVHISRHAPLPLSRRGEAVNWERPCGGPIRTARRRYIMKKRGRPAIKRQPATIRSFYYLHTQVAEFTANPDSTLTVFDDPVEPGHVVRGVDDGLLAVGVNCNELYFHGDSLLIQDRSELRHQYQQGRSPSQRSCLNSGTCISPVSARRSLAIIYGSPLWLTQNLYKQDQVLGGGDPCGSLLAQDLISQRQTDR